MAASLLGCLFRNLGLCSKGGGPGGREDMLAYPVQRRGSRNAGVSPVIECRATRLCEQGGAAVAWPCVSWGGLGLSGE